MVFNFFWNVILKAFNAFFFYVNIFTLFFPLLTWLLACLAGWSQAKVTFLFSQFLSLSHLFPTPAAACNRQIWLFLLSRFSVHQSYRPFSKSSPACLLACLLARLLSPLKKCDFFHSSSSKIRALFSFNVLLLLSQTKVSAVRKGKYISFFIFKLSI